MTSTPAQPVRDTLRQRVLDFVGTEQRTRQELLDAFPTDPAVMRTVHILVTEGLLRSLRQGAAGPGTYARPSNNGADLVKAWHSPSPVHQLNGDRP